MKTAAWDKLASACARAEIRTGGRDEQLQPDPGQRLRNPVSTRNLPAGTRSTQSRHCPQLPARRIPRLRSRLPEGVAPDGHAPRGRAVTRQTFLLGDSRASLPSVGGTLAAPWLPVGGALSFFLSRGRGCRVAPARRDRESYPAPQQSPGWSSVDVLTGVVGCPTYHASVPRAQPTDLPARNVERKAGLETQPADSAQANSGGFCHQPLLVISALRRTLSTRLSSAI